MARSVRSRLMIDGRLTFMAGCLARTPFPEQVAVAAGAGFDSITCWPNVWRHAERKLGMGLGEMRAVLDDHGLALTDVDGCNDWVPDRGSIPAGPTMRCDRQEYFEVCELLGGSTLVAVHRAGVAVDLGRDVPAFARLCDDAAEHGLRVALEFVGFLGVADVATAWSIVRAADRPNAGLVVDLAHHIRAGRDDGALRAVPAERVFTVQLSDGPAPAPADLAHEAMFGRRLPGDGQWDVPQFVATLQDMGVRCSVGPEVNVDDGRPPEVLAAELMAATRRVLSAADRSPE